MRVCLHLYVEKDLKKHVDKKQNKRRKLTITKLGDFSWKESYLAAAPFLCMCNSVNLNAGIVLCLLCASCLMVTHWRIRSAEIDVLRDVSV